MKEIAKEIKNRFSQLGITLPEEKIQQRLERLTREFKVPTEEAKRSVINYFLKEHNLDKGTYYANSPDHTITTIKDINQEGQWITLKIKVTQLWDSNHESILQTGLMGDETGVIKFTRWKNTDKNNTQQLLQENKTYEIKNAVTSVWQGKYQINLNRATEITQLEEDIEVGTTTTTYTGVIVDVQTGSGLIKRCPECNRALTKGVCSEHGKVEGAYDLRIKAVIDNGQDTQDIILNRELSEQLTGITLEEARTMATEALDHSVVAEAIKSKIIGRYYNAEGIKIDRYLITKSITPLKIPKETINELLAQLQQHPVPKIIPEPIEKSPQDAETRTNEPDGSNQPENNEGEI